MRSGSWVFAEAGDPARLLHLKDTQIRSLFGRHRENAQTDLGADRKMALQKPAIIHPVEVVPRQNQNVLGTVRQNVPQGLAHRVGRPLIPHHVLGRLLRRKDIHEALGEDSETVGLSDMPVERLRVVLRQDEDSVNAGIDAVADRDVDQSILAAQGHGGLRPDEGQWKQPGPFSTSQNNPHDVFHTLPNRG
jgi:hypothetical protein